jgi:TM2 domain-containing membrane protein YozV
MTCAVHSNVEATGFCRNCGKALCPECTRDVGGALYCEPCLAAKVATPPVASSTASNPGLALFLGFIPGLGAVYNGQYMKAAIHVLIFGGLIAALSSDFPGGIDAFFGVALGAFVCYMPLDAYRTAKARLLGEPEPPNLLDGPGRKPIGAFVLIGIGALLLMGNFGLLQRDWFEKSWPIALIVIGGFLLWDRMKPTA